MAGYNEILVGRFNRALQKALGMKGAASMNELSTTLQANFSFFWGTEMRYLEDWDQFQFGVTVPAQGAAQPSSLRIRNPSTSGVVAVVEKITIANLAAAANSYSLQSQLIGTDLVNDITPNIARLDPRFAAGQANLFPACALKISFGTGVLTVPSVIGVYTLLIGTMFDLINDEPCHLVLLPGVAFHLQGGTLNQEMSSTWKLRYRPLEDSEKR